MDIQAVNLEGRIALTDSGEVCRITNLLDCDGDETIDPKAAVSAVATLNANTWFAIDLSKFDAVEHH